MGTPTIIALIAAIAAVVISFIALAKVIYLAGVQMAQMSVKVDTMWDFQIRRAMSEAVDKGVAIMNSPLLINEGVRQFLNPLKDELVEFWNSGGGKQLPPTEALLELERLFGDRLLTAVCIPCHLSHGACLLLAYSVASDSRQLNFEIGN